jgi:hypothetical protein
MLTILQRSGLVGPMCIVSLLGTFSSADASTISCPESGTVDRQVSFSATLTCDIVVDPGVPRLVDDLATTFGGTFEEVDHETIGSTWEWYFETVAPDMPAAVVEPDPIAVEPAPAEPALPISLVTLPEPGGGAGTAFLTVTPPAPSIGTELIVPVGPPENLPMGPPASPPGPPASVGAATVSSVPEPVSLVLLSGGLLGIAAMLRRRNGAAPRSKHL